MADFYTVNLSFQASSHDQAKALDLEVRSLADRLVKSGRIVGYQSDFGRDWLALARPASPLRAAANKLLTSGPADDE